MNEFFLILRKSLTGITIIVFSFAVTYVPHKYSTEIVPQVYAQGIGGATEATQLKNTLAGTVSAAADKAQTGKEFILDKIAKIIAQTMISQMLQSMVTWINSGFEGSPAFIQDIDRFLLDVADEAAGEYIKTLGEIGSFICEPFRLDIQLALSLKYQKARERRNIDSCTVSGIVDNIEDFFNNQVDNKNFWRQWIEVTSKPQTYTPYGQFMAAEAELNARLENAKGQELKKIDWGEGFLSNEVCELIEGPTSPAPQAIRDLEAETLVDPIRQQEARNNFINEISTPVIETRTGAMNTLPNHELPGTDTELSLAPTGLLAQATTNTPASAAAPAGKQRCVISTPGKVISEQLNKALGAGQDQLVAADEINEVISALLGQIANQALTGTAGLLGLSSNTGYTNSGYSGGSYVDSLVSDVSTSEGSYTEQGIIQLEEKLAIQEKYNDLSNEYIPLLRLMMSDTTALTDLRSRAQVSYEDALTVRDTTDSHISILRPLVAEFYDLERESTTADIVRLEEIDTRKSEIISQGRSYRAYTEERYDASRREWSAIARQ